MGLDIIEIALDGLTDHVEFEKLASEIMRGEGYPSIKPLGGVADMARDAIQESYFFSERRTRVVFQYTLQEYVSGKIEDTIAKLSANNIDYHELVIVTRTGISTERQEKMIRDVRKKHGVTLIIYERKTIANRLANYENGIFHRHFPDIRKQVVDLTSKQLLLSDDKSSLFESAMLKASIAFTFGEGASRARKSIFDFLTLGLLLENPSEYMPIVKLPEKYRRILGGKRLPVAQIKAALQRLMTKGLLEYDGDSVRATKFAIQSMAGSTIQANVATNSLTSDIIDEVCRISRRRLPEHDRQRIVRNTQDVLMKLLQLFGIELANQVLGDATPSPVYLDSSQDLVDAAKRQLSPDLGELLISVISQTLKTPTTDQAQTLANWSLAYLGLEIMNIDPYLKEFQATRFANKIFILDTDFILDCLVTECLRSTIYVSLIGTLISLGCRVIIPESCMQECVSHACISPRTYNHFGPRLLSLGDSFVDENVGNVFVKGYYYGRLNGNISPRTVFEEYLQNYYEPRASIPFVKEILQTVFPAGVEILNPTTLLTEDIPEDQMSGMYAALLERMLRSRKSEYRSKDENEELAQTDARLFLTVLHLNGEAERSSGYILGGLCYLITASGRYLRSSREIGLRDVVTTRPQSLVALLDLVGGIKMTPTEFVSLFENPLIIYAVSQAWADVQALIESGIVLQGKSIARLRWDLDKGLHEKIVALREADTRAEPAEEAADLVIGDHEYIELLKSAASRGYRRIPELDPLIEAVEKARNDAQGKSQAFDELLRRYEGLEKAIAHFGKRKQRYLRKMDRKRTGE